MISYQLSRQHMLMISSIMHMISYPGIWYHLMKSNLWNMISCLLTSDIMQLISDLISNDILHWYHVEYHSIHPHPDWMLPARNWFDKCLIKVEPLTPSVACAAAAIRWRLLRGRFARTLSGRLLSIAIMLSTAVYPKGAFKAWESKVCQLWATSRNRV